MSKTNLHPAVKDAQRRDQINAAMDRGEGKAKLNPHADSTSTRLQGYREAMSLAHEGAEELRAHAKANGRGLHASEQRDADEYERVLKAAKSEADRLAAQIQREVQTIPVDQWGDTGDGAPPSWSASGDVRPAQRWAGQVAAKLTAVADSHGIRALGTGLDIPTVVEPIVEKPSGAPHRVTDLLLNRKIVTSNDFAYMRESVRTSNAAVVADGEVKPTSNYDFEDVADRLRVFAHLTEPFAIRLLEDHAELERILATQMADDLERAIEAEALAGDGTGEHLTGVLNTSGVQVQPFATDVLATLRKALTSMVTAGEQPSAWVLNYGDLETFDLMRESGSTGAFLGDVSARVFGNLPVVGSTAVPVGTALLGDWNQTRLYARANSRLDLDTGAELFERNQVRLRCESRVGFALLRPSAFVKIDLTAG